MTTPNKSEEAKKKLLEKIPEVVGNNKVIGLQLAHFKKLSDQEFALLWHMPLDIVISPNTRKYVEKRRLELGLVFTQYAGYKHIEVDAKKEKEGES